ncbi:MAG: TonB-dependent receptor [Marinilabiliaceae bacterium]|nr:TonB-dependent receptor [Marinilabiliaceae bacterium]
MKKVNLLITIGFCLINLQAQNQLTGIIKDGAGDGSPVPYATAALLQPDSTVITGTMANDDGRFVLTNVKEGDYILQVSFIGYEREYRNVNVPAQSDLGDIFLSVSTNELGEVVVKSNRPLVEQRIDRMVVNVAGNIITAGASVNDVLKRLPGLIVDQNGNVIINGRTATVHIDGRPTQLPPEQIAQMLSGMDGELIDRVELIHNPSSRYDATETAIVNIRLKKDASLGVNGRVSAGVGFSDNDFLWRSGVNINYRSKKLNVFGNYNVEEYPRQSELYENKTFKDVPSPVMYDQQSIMRWTGPDQTLRAGIDYFITPKQTLGFLFNGTNSNLDGTTNSTINIAPIGIEVVDSSVLSDSRLIDKYYSQIYNLNYRLGISEGEELTVDADYGNVSGRNWQNMNSRYHDKDKTEMKPTSEFQYNGVRNIDILSLKTDYTKPLSEKSKLETGIKIAKTVTDNEIVYKNKNNEIWEIDNNQSNRFKYSEEVSAGYATYSHSFGKFMAMAGLRAEYTSLKGESEDTTFTRSYIDWFPSAFLHYQINERQALNVSYSRKIHRPGFSLLNPFRTYIDRFTYESGNPDLKPLYYNSFSLNYNFGGIFVGAGYTHLTNIFESVYEQDDLTHTTSIMKKNIGKRERADLSLNVPIPLTKWYHLTIMSQVGWMMEDTRYNGKQFKNDFFFNYTSSSHAFTILPTLKAHAQVMWLTGGWQGIMQFDGYWRTDAQIEKTFYNNRLSVTLYCYDVFNSHVMKGKIKFDNIDQTFENKYNYRNFLLNIRYNFGSQQIRSARNRNVGIDEEMGRTR